MEPLFNVTLQVPFGLATVFTVAFVVYAIKSVL
jgi:hypothetical protein